MKDGVIDFFFSAESLMAPWLAVASRLGVLGMIHSTAQGGNEPEEDSLIRVPRQESVNQATAAAYQLARHSNERLHKRLELQAENPLFLLALGRLMAAGVSRQTKCPPRLEVRAQRRHYHVRPIARQIVHGRAQRVASAVQLRTGGFPDRSARWR
jgi:hypothetical protein